MSSQLEQFLDELAAERRLPAAGTGTAVAVAIAAALVEMVARSAGDRETGGRARELRQRALSLAEADAKAYADVVASDAEPSGPATDVPLAIAETAAEVHSLASALGASVSETLGADAVAAGVLAEAGARAAAGLVLVNLGEGSDDPRADRARRLLHGDRPPEQPWALSRRLAVGATQIAWDTFGDGPPVVLIHGTPSWSYLWRHVAPVLSERFTVYALDLPGYGDSAASPDADLSIAAHAKVLVELLDEWGLERPAVAGHDIGGAIALRAHLLHERRFSRIALVDAVVLAPWITPTTRHVQAHLDVYGTMPSHVFERITAGHLRTAVHRPLGDEAFAAYHGRWTGKAGQAAYLHKVACFDENDTRELEPLLPGIDVPVQIVWGEHDCWLDPAVARRLAELVPGAELVMIEDAGHFAMEDAPAEVAQALLGFFSG